MNIAMNEQQVRELFARYQALEQVNVNIMAQLGATLMAVTTLTTARAPAALATPKTKVYRGKRFDGRKEDFEAFTTQYRAESILETKNFQEWSEEQKLAFLTSALEGKALDVVRSTIILNAAHLTHNTIFTALERAFKDATIGQRALTQLQSIKQKEDVEGYTREFNTLVGLASGVAVLDAGTLLRYFLQGLKMNLRVGVVSTQPGTLAVAQTLVSLLDIILQGQQMKTKEEAMDTIAR
jgi:Retrotransposon gag protein